MFFVRHILHLTFLPFPMDYTTPAIRAGRAPTTKADLKAMAPLRVTPADKGDAWQTAPNDHPLRDGELLR